MEQLDLFSSVEQMKNIALNLFYKCDFIDALPLWRQLQDIEPDFSLIPIALRLCNYWENVIEFQRLAREYRDRSLTDFLENIALVSDQDTVDTDANAVTLLTLHAAKGLEFPVVFIVGLNEGTLPHFRSFEDEEEMQEECRLLYVGVTRAMDRLYLLHTLKRYSYGYSEPAAPSRFLDDIPFTLLDDDRPTVPNHRTHPSTEWDTATSPTPIKERAYQPGMKVDHNLWGEGLVLKSVLEEDDEIVDVFFESVGLKRLAASIAKLEVKH